jgi:hypothetical protein
MVTYHSVEAAANAMQLHLQNAHQLAKLSALPDPTTRRMIDEHLTEYQRAAHALARLEERNRRATRSLREL